MKRENILLISIIAIEVIIIALIHNPAIFDVTGDTSEKDYEKIRDNFDPSSSGDPENTNKILVETESPLYRTLSPNMSYFSDGYTVKIPYYYVETNSHGLREEEFKTRNPENKTRILVIGDSQTFGWGINRSRRYTEIVEKKLNKNHEEKFQFINAGTPGYGMKDYYLYLKHKGLDYNPDKIILAFHITDSFSLEKNEKFQEKAKEKIPGNTTERNISNERFKEELEEITRNYLYNLDMDNSNFTKYLNRFDETARNKNIPATYFAIKHVNNSWFNKWAERNNRTIIFPPEKLEYNSEKHKISEKDSHYNEKGHQILAEKLYRNLKQEYKLEKKESFTEKIYQKIKKIPLISQLGKPSR